MKSWGGCCWADRILDAVWISRLGIRKIRAPQNQAGVKPL